MKIYLDYAATTPVKPEIFAAMEPYLKEKFGNPSSIHSWGRAARAAVDEAREKIANFLNAKPSEIVFTSGGTEADNLAICGLIKGLGSPSRSDRPSHPSLDIRQLADPGHRRALEGIHSVTGKFHIITSQIEHHAVLNTCKVLEKERLVEVTYIKPNRDGIIKAEKIQKAIKPNTVLVSIMYVNNEIGTIQPIREIGKMIEKEREKRLAFSVQGNSKNSKTLNAVRCYPIFFHTDAVQATEYQKMDVDFLHVDLLTISGHKIGAPKGIGALYIRKGTPIRNIIFGGEQEMGLRPGTENVAGIVGLGKAVEIIQNSKFKIQNLRDYFIDKVLNEIPDVELNGSKDLRSPNNVNFYFKYIEGESILLNLDLVGIATSSGSACTSQSLEPSHVLMAVYEDPERAHGSIRFTLGEQTTKEEIDYTIFELKKIVKKLRQISPLTPLSYSGQAKEKNE